MLKANELREEAFSLDREGERILTDIKAANVSRAELAGLRATFIQPRQDAANALRAAATALDRIPALGIGRA